MGLNRGLPTEEIRARFEAGATKADIAREFGCTRSTVAWHISGGKSRPGDPQPASQDKVSATEQLAVVTVKAPEPTAQLRKQHPRPGNGHPPSSSDELNRYLNERWAQLPLLQKVQFFLGDLKRAG